MEKKPLWTKPVCITVTQEELRKKIVVSSCSKYN